MAGEGGLANEIRAGLKTPELKVIMGGKTKDKWNELFFGKPIRAHVKEFGALFGTIFFVIASFRLWNGRAAADAALWVSIGAFFAYTGYRVPEVLHPIWKGWMKFAHYLGIVMTFLLMSIVWCVAFIPMSLLVKAIGKNPISMKFRTEPTTYWVDRNPLYDDFKRMEKQF